MLCIVVPYYGFSQSCDLSVRGQVVDFHDGTPLIGAEIILVDQNTTGVSDQNGNYEFDGLCAGNYELIISHPECTTQTISVYLETDRILDITLEHHLEELEEVRVVGEAISDKTNSAQEKGITASVLDLYSSSSLGDALKEVIGVSSLNTGSNIVKPVIHGLSGTRVLILNDGVRMQDMEWGEEHAPNVDINSAGTATVIKGASALQYGGDAIGGVILLEQERVFARDTLFGKTQISGMTNGRGGTLATELSKTYGQGWFLKGQGSYKRLGDQEAPDYILSNTGIQEVGASVHWGKRQLEWGFDMRYSYYDADIAILRASHIGNVDDLIRGINSGEPQFIAPFTYELDRPRQAVTHHLGKASFYKRFEGQGKLSVQYDFQNNRRFEFDVRVGADRDKASIDLDLTTHSAVADFKWDAKENYQIQAGLMGRYQNNFANPDTGVRRLIPDYDKYDLGAYFIADFIANNNWELDAGIRYDFVRVDAKKFYQVSRWVERGYDQEFQELVIDDLGTQLLTNPVFNYHNISATAGANYSKSKESVLRLNYALSQRAPNPSELFSDGLHHSAARIELGDLRIKSETAHKLSVAQEWAFKGWGLTLEPYVNFIQDFILLEPSGVEFTIRGAFPVWEFRQTDARILGFDASGYINWTDHWKSDHSFAITKGKDTENGIPLINMPAARLGNRLTYTTNGRNGFEIGLRSDYVFRQNEVPPNITVFSPEQQQEVLLEINTAPDAYHLVGIHSQMDFALGAKTMLTASLTVNNVFDTEYRDYLNRQRYFADDLGRNIIVQLKLNY